MLLFPKNSMLRLALNVDLSSTLISCYHVVTRDAVHLLSSDTQSPVLASNVLRAARYFGAGERGSGRLCSRPRGGPRGTLVPGGSSGRGHCVTGALFWRDERRAGEELLRSTDVNICYVI